MHRVFLLSPAKASGRRAQMLTRPAATFELARRVQIGDATLGEVFTFCSGLYFRGKLTYARRFADPPPSAEGVQIITPSRGLLPTDFRVGLAELSDFSGVDVATSERRFTEPLTRSVHELARASSCEFVLLGSIATGKYVETLLPILGDRLRFPGDFVGRGDMSRGALLLRSAAAGAELDYIAVAGAAVTGPRAQKLSALKPKSAR